MARGELTTHLDCEDFVRGCEFFGTGGGGPARDGLGRLIEALDEGIPLRWVDPSEIPDDAWTCTVFGMGSAAPRDDATDPVVEALGLTMRLGYAAMETAVTEYAAFTGKAIDVIVVSELGGGATPGALVAAMRLGMICVDGDYSGRAVPELMQGTPYLRSKGDEALTSVDTWGDVVIVKHATNSLMLERIGKWLSIAARSRCYQATTLLSGVEMRDLVIPGTLTRCHALGRVMREARERSQDPIAAVIGEVDGYLLFEGTVVSKEWEDRDGYLYGTTTVSGVDRFAGHTLRIWFMNENHITWLDGEPWVTSPDLVVVADRQTGEAYLNASIDAGCEISVVGIRGWEAFRSERGLSCAGPRHFGYDFDYRPIEELLDQHQ
jgi:DUF917 family protein